MMLEVIWAGQVAYDVAWNWQKQLVAQRQASPELPDVLLLLEHPHTYTLGRRGKRENLLWDEATLAQKGVAVHHVDRGGDITYHGPGQLVGYPILNLKRLGRPGLAHVRPYIHDIEEVLIQAVAAVGVNGRRLEGYTGVWVEEEHDLTKIAAIGVRIHPQGLTSHGFALNVATDLSYFDGIIPCGITDHGVTSVQKVTKRPYQTTDLIPHITQAFENIFHVNTELKESIHATR